jgi:hypothetical protein
MAYKVRFYMPKYAIGYIGNRMYCTGECKPLLV